MSRRAVFLDRDGTLNIKAPEHEYVATAQDFVWTDGAPKALATLARSGYALAVISNQRGISRGLVSSTGLREIEQRIQRDLAAEGCAIEAFRYCVHGDTEGCDCRKPRPGMIFDLAEEFNFDLGSSWVIGDAPTDVAAGRAAGCRTALVGGGSGDADLVAPSLAAAAGAIASGLHPASLKSDSNSSTKA